MQGISDPVVIGTVVGPHGVRGTLKVRPSGSGRHLREGVVPSVDDVRRRIIGARSTPKGFLVQLDGIHNREEAEVLRGRDLTLDRSELDSLPDDEVYVGDLPGMLVVDEMGETLGEVKETFETPAHEVLVVKSGDEELYIPFTLEHIPDIDLESGRIVARPSELEE